MDLSIIVPVYNVEEYLEECLNSLYSIRGIEKEIIIVNDGSTDSSHKIINNYLNKYPLETKIINQENKGLSGARNSGIKEAKGRYISFIDSDDFIDPKKYSELFYNGTKLDLDIIVGGFKYKTEEKSFITKPMLDRKSKLSYLETSSGLEFFENSYEKSRDEIRVEVVTNIFKREVLNKYQLFFKEKLLHEDTLFMYLAMFYAEKVKYFPNEFYYYRIRTGSIMNNITYKNYIHKLYIAKQLQSFKDKNKLNHYSWDSLICALYFAGLRKYKMKNLELYNEIRKNKKLTKLSLFKRVLIPFYHLVSKEVEISLVDKD
jgi:glycosyltransferase involved in cell wall biosynthesis